jgi:hypothetical protein
MTDITDVEIGGAGPGAFAKHKDGTISFWGSGVNKDWSLKSIPRGEAKYTNTSADSPVPIPELKGVGAFEETFFVGCGLFGGAVKCWGVNAYTGSGQDGGHALGPVTVKGISDAVAVGAGSYHACALHKTGKVSCWGRNQNGESLPDQKTKSVLVPGEVKNVKVAP